MRCLGKTFSSRVGMGRMDQSGLRVSLVALLCVLMTGCFSLSWRRELRFEPPAAGVIESLQMGKTDLQQSLQRLGAPLWVLEYPAPNGQGSALAYGWFENQDRGFRISAPTNRTVSPSFSYEQIDERMQGLVLFFDEDWKLQFWRRGLLRDLTREIRRRRPLYLEEKADSRT